MIHLGSVQNLVFIHQFREILHAETVDKREVGLQSSNIEREALIRSLNFYALNNY